MAMATDTGIKKEFTQEQIALLIAAIGMYVNSMDRRINSESDIDAQAIWQNKKDKANIVASKLRLTDAK